MSKIPAWRRRQIAREEEDAQERLGLLMGFEEEVPAMNEQSHITNSERRTVSEVEEEIIEIDENGVVHAVGDAEEDIAIEPEPDDISECLVPLDPEPDTPGGPIPPASGTEHVATVAGPLPLIELLPLDFKLPLLTRFIPNPALREAADQAASYALAVPVQGAEGLTRADTALTALRATLRVIDDHFDEPQRIAFDLHRRLTTIHGEWKAAGDTAVKTVGQRIYTEQKRLEAVATEARRKAQENADREAKDAARREAEAAAKAHAPAAVVEELKKQAETATAPPVPEPSFAPPLRGSSTVERWKARIAGTPGSDNPQPPMTALTPAQRQQMLTLLRAVVADPTLLMCVELNWKYLDSRARSDKTTLSIPGIEAYEEGGIRSKGTRRR